MPPLHAGSQHGVRQGTAVPQRLEQPPSQATGYGGPHLGRPSIWRAAAGSGEHNRQSGLLPVARHHPRAAQRQRHISGGMPASRIWGGVPGERTPFLRRPPQRVSRRACIHIAHGSQQRPRAAIHAAMPAPHILRAKCRERLRRTERRQAIRAIAERLSIGQLEGVTEHVVGELLLVFNHEASLGLDVAAGEGGLGCDLRQQLRGICHGPRLGCHRDACPVGRGRRGQDPAQPLEGDRQLGGIELRRASGHRARGECGETRVLGCVERCAGHVHPERHQRDARLVPEEKVGIVQGNELGCGRRRPRTAIAPGTEGLLEAAGG